MKAGFPNGAFSSALPLYVAYPLLGYGVQFWCSHFKKDADNVEMIQKRATRMICYLENMP